MGKMVDLKRSKSDVKKSHAVMAEPSHDEYSYGTRVNLEDHEMGKLGMDKMPKIGDVVHFHAKARVVSASQHASKDRKDRSVGLQIEHMRIGKGDPETAVDAVNGGIEEAGE